VGLGGCSWFQFPGVYRLAIQQGNIVTQEMVDQLQPGMTKRQVNFVLGSPLIKDSFHQDRWDYYYSLRDPHGDTRKERLTIYFSNDQLTHMTGDYQPSNANSGDPIVDAAASELERAVEETESPVPDPEDAPVPEEIEENRTEPENINPEPSIDGRQNIHSNL